jgi:hypothetical protein
MAKPITNAWTEEEIKRLFAGRALNMSFQQIADEYLPGRTASAAQYHYNALTKGRPSTYSVTDPGIAGNEAAYRSVCADGSRRLLEAYARYFEKHVASRAA